MSIFITGSSGFIAGGLKECFQKEKPHERILMLGRSESADYMLDLLYPDKFPYETFSAGDIVLHTAAVSSPDQCEKEYETSRRVNVEGTGFFLREAIRQGCKVVFFSSDAVFGSDASVVYTEDSPMLADTAYGKMKKTIEEEFEREALFKSVRLPYVVAAKDRFTSYCIDCINQEKEVEVFHPFYRSCITMGDLRRVILWLVDHYETFSPNCLNLAGEELVSRVRIADELNRIFGDRLHYKVCDPGDTFYICRPRISQMKSRYLYEQKILPHGSFSEKFREELEGVSL